ncbi:MAG: hypothetical protein K2Z81_23800 [Cyanobacteria bacterium]|nr:hypothetical protein [Cyanobacteriota bacterium]
MGHTIEAAKSGRASCRTCKQAIGKGELRFGEEVPNPFSEGEMSFKWHHLPCAAKKKPSALKEAIESTELEVPDKDDLLKTIESSSKNEKATKFPHAEHAPTGRAACMACSEKIEKGDLRLAVRIEDEPGSFAKAGYLHPACAVEHTGEDPEELMDKLKANSLNLADGDLEALEQAIFD